MCGLIIFDFDGVLVDSFHPFYRLNRDAMASLDIPLTQQQYRDLYSGNIHLGLKSLISNADSLNRFTEFKNLYGDAYRMEIDFFPGAVDFIQTLDRKIHLSIVSAGKQEFIESILAREKIRDCFCYISGSQNHTKASAIHEALSGVNARPEEAYMITDTSGDVLVAKGIGIKTIAVTWGFHDLETLKSVQPDFIVSTFKELSEILDRCLDKDTLKA